MNVSSPAHQRQTGPVFVTSLTFLPSTRPVGFGEPALFISDSVPLGQCWREGAPGSGTPGENVLARERAFRNVCVGLEERGQLWRLLEGDPVFLHEEPIARAGGMR